MSTNFQIPKETWLSSDDLKNLTTQLITSSAKRVLVQLPDGFLGEPVGLLSQAIKAAGAMAFFSGDPCYGACDLAITSAEQTKCDTLIHIGHSEWPYKPETVRAVNVIFIEAYSDHSLDSAATVALEQISRLGWSRLGLCTTIQYLRQLENVKKILNDSNLVVKLTKSTSKVEMGQILGCEVSGAKAIENEVDGILCIAPGRFHGVGLARNLKKPTLIVDPYSCEWDLLDDQVRMKYFKQRYAQIEAARAKSLWGVLYSTKTAQNRETQVEKIRELIESTKKETVVVVAQSFSPEHLMNFHLVEVWVNTACPRINEDDAFRYNKPVLSIPEARVALGIDDWDSFVQSY